MNECPRCSQLAASLSFCVERFSVFLSLSLVFSRFSSLFFRLLFFVREKKKSRFLVPPKAIQGDVRIQLHTIHTGGIIRPLDEMWRVLVRAACCVLRSAAHLPAYQQECLEFL
jgi:hypothetical protein